MNSNDDLFPDLQARKSLETREDTFLSESDKSYLKNLIGTMLAEALVSAGIVDKG